MINETIVLESLALLSFILAVVEFLHAKEEGKDAFTKNPGRKFSGLQFSEQIETYKSKTQVGFVVYKLMMIAIFFIIALFAFPTLLTKTIGFVIVGIYLLYQWHHLYEWHIRKKENHGRKTAWAYVPIAMVWWWMVIELITKQI